MSVVTIVAVVGIVAYVIGRQLLGEPLRGKRLLILPVLLLVVGVANVASRHGHHPKVIDIVLLVIGAAIAAVVGLSQGLSKRLEVRHGSLWGQMPIRSLWLWGALVVSRGILDGLGYAVGARVATGSAAILLTLGINRLAQAVVVAPRALAAGIPFAPEKDGTSMLSGVFGANIEAPYASPPSDIRQRQESLPVSLSSRFIDHTSDQRSTSQVVESNLSVDIQSRQDWRLLLRQIVDRLDGHTR